MREGESGWAEATEDTAVVVELLGVAHPSSMLYEQVVHGQPPIPREDLHQVRLDLVAVLLVTKTQPVGKVLHVGVYDYALHYPIGVAQDDVHRLPGDPL